MPISNSGFKDGLEIEVDGNISTLNFAIIDQLLCGFWLAEFRNDTGKLNFIPQLRGYLS
jgi:hypothetical protein